MVKQTVVKEFPAVGGYRIRVVVEEKRNGNGKPALDIRQYVQGKNFEGFTRRGIRLGARSEVARLGDILKEIVQDQSLGFHE